MPLIRMETSKHLEEAQRDEICRQLSLIAAEIVGKPEEYVQAIVSRDACVIRHGGTAGDAAFVEVRSIGGLTPKVNAALAARVCELLGRHGIPPARIYLNFVDVRATHWGHDGSTFG
ncbi:MAG: ABC transporter substrate-binding protein [Deltaproteobacteria bacterium]|nr:ABC transporter substrate-binding protein [Deltaproteobacteria bacterium]